MLVDGDTEPERLPVTEVDTLTRGVHELEIVPELDDERVQD